MSKTIFMRVEEVAEEMGVSVSYAYKLIRSQTKSSRKQAVSLFQDELTANSSTRKSMEQKK